MEISQLRYFYTVANTESFSRASEMLGISQPALSKSLKLLQSEFEEALLVPSGRGIRVTDFGRLLAAKAGQVLEQIEQLGVLEDKQQEKKTISIASFEVFSTYFLGKLISKEFCDYKTNILELLPGEIEEAIASRAADVGITYLPIPNKHLDFLKVTSFKMGVFGRADIFASHAFEDLPFVVPLAPINNTPSKVKGLDGWPDHRYPRNIQDRVTMMETALEFCRSGRSVGYFPEFIVGLHNEKLARRFRLSEIVTDRKFRFTKQDVYLVKRKSQVESSILKKFARALRVGI